MDEGNRESISEMERRVQQILQQMGIIRKCERLEQMDEAYPPPEVSRSCGHQAEYVRRREGMIITLFGRVSFRRIYYLRPECHHEQYPLDERLSYRPGWVTPGLTGTLERVGAEVPFERAGDLQQDPMRVSLSENACAMPRERWGLRP